MRISDWSSDVCSSDLRDKRFFAQIQAAISVDAIFKALENWMKTEDNLGCLFLRAYAETGGDTPKIADAVSAHKAAFWRKIREEIGRAACRERVCQYGSISVVAGKLKKKHTKQD